MALSTTLRDVARDPQRPRILIARMSAIGDTILTTPAVNRLRREFPGAFLAWVVEEKSACFVRDHPAVDSVVVLPRGWFTNARQLLALRRRLRGMRLDATVDFQGLTKSALACRLSGAPLRVGLSGEHGRELSVWLNNHLVAPTSPHITDRSLELVDAVGIEAAPDRTIEWNLPRETASEQRVARWLASAGGEVAAGRFALINPGASWDSKLWVNDRFADLAIQLRTGYGLPTVVVWGGSRERGWADEIVSESHGAAVLGPETSLQELSELLRCARLVISPDTGPMHLAVAVGTPTVGLFGVTRPEDCGPYGAPHEAVQRRFQAGGRKERRRAGNDAMREITVDDALSACGVVLARTEHRYRERFSA